MTESVDIADIITTVAEGIREAERRAAGERKVLALAECEVEIAVKATVDGKGGLKFWVIEAGGGRASEDTSRIKLKFTSVGDVQVE